MRTIGVLAMAAFALATSGAAAGATTQPSLRPTQLGAPAFVGERFAPLDLVKVTLTMGGRTFTRTVRASRTGAFTVRFDLVAVEPCRGAVLVTAVDAAGATVRWKRLCRPPSVSDGHRVS